MTMIQGTVQEISTKMVDTKFGTKPTYSFKVAEKWVKHGFKNPMVEAGYLVEFDGVEGKYGMEASGVKVLSKSSPSATIVPTSGFKPYVPAGSGYKEKVFPIPALHGDRSIVRQNALARAVEIFNNTTDKDGSFPPTEETISMIIHLARSFEAYTAGDLDMGEAKAEMAAERESVAKFAEMPG